MKKLSLLLLLVAGFSAGLAQTKAEDVKQFTLANGMKIFVLEDRSIPNANMYLFWKVGSRNEQPGLTGLSHFFEHMMFNGAKKYGPKMFDRVMEASGGRNNAYTTENVTVYTDWFQSGALETIFDLEADRIAALDINAEMTESERGVVLSERRTGLENSNWQALNRFVKSSAFYAHPYRWPVIGYESDIKSWTVQDLKDYFKTYYAPNNCVTVIVGDVKFDEVKKLAEKYFGPIPRGPEPAVLRTVEPEQIGERRVRVYKEVSSANVSMAWHVPATQSDDYYALMLLDAVLSQGRTSRLQKALVDEQQIATNVFTYMPMAFDPNLFYVFAVGTPGTSAEKLENALSAEVDRIIAEGLSEKEVQKVKNAKLVEFYQDISTIDGKANNIGTYELFFGDYKKLFTAPADYEKVTAEDIRRVAAKYFIKTNRTVGQLVKPEKTDNSEK